MSLITMVVWDTEENQRHEYTNESLLCLRDTVDWRKHRMVISDNGSCPESQEITKKLGGLINAHIIYNKENIGTARALNKGLALRKPNEHCVKIDGDIVIHETGWADKMEEVFERDPSYGIIGLKRKDLAQYPTNPDLTFKSELVMLPHETGQTWITVEECGDIIGSCTMFNYRLIDAIGYSFQPGIYGFEDVLYGLRGRLAGFKNGFLSHIVIDHIDRGDNGYTPLKQRLAAEKWDEYRNIHQEYVDGVRPIYYDGGF